MITYLTIGCVVSLINLFKGGQNKVGRMSIHSSCGSCCVPLAYHSGDYYLGGCPMITYLVIGAILSMVNTMFFMPDRHTLLQKLRETCYLVFLWPVVVPICIWRYK